MNYKKDLLQETKKSKLRLIIGILCFVISIFWIINRLIFNQIITSFDWVYAATGFSGQMTIVFPELDLIFLRRQSCNKDISGNMTWMGPEFSTLITSLVKKK